MSIIPKIKPNKENKVMPKQSRALQSNKKDYNKSESIPLVDKLKQQLFINK
jgi:hypothetical protein